MVPSYEQAKQRVRVDTLPALLTLADHVHVFSYQFEREHVGISEGRTANEKGQVEEVKSEGQKREAQAPKPQAISLRSARADYSSTDEAS